MDPKTNTGIDTYLLDCFSNGSVQLFVGSGLSNGIFPSPEDLMERLINEQFYLDGQASTLENVLNPRPPNLSLEDAAEFFELYAGPEALIQMVKKIYGTKIQSTELHKQLWTLPNVRWIYTTNFDCLIEDAFRRPKQVPQVITSCKGIQELPKTRRVVFKPHGCARLSDNRSDFVLSRNDYLNYSHLHSMEMLKTLYDISTKAFLFLGYSIRDLNMRHIIVEANRVANVKSYAVLKDLSGPESRYWKNLGVILIQDKADSFVKRIQSCVPSFNEFEWDLKVDDRVAEKEEISRKAFQKLKDCISSNKSLTVIIDAGSTTLAFGRAIAKASIAEDISLQGIRIITNSPLVVEELDPAIRRSKGQVDLTIIGGPLRFDTRAYTPDSESAKSQLRELSKPDCQVVAFIGATAIDNKSLMTKTEAEVAIKKAFIEASSKVFVLADHSKNRSLMAGYSFAEWDYGKMTIISDRPDEMRPSLPEKLIVE